VERVKEHDMRLKEKVVIVTGGASGIGEACVRRFLAEGAAVVIADIDDARGRSLSAQLGERTRFIHADHTVKEQVDAAVALAESAFGSLDVLHNNAAAPHRGPLDSIDEGTLRRVLDVNLLGPFLMTQAALPALRRSAARHGQASVIFTASIQSVMVRPNFTLYGATKHGVGGLVGSLALELAAEGIRVNGICPGSVDTPLLRDIAASTGDLEQGLAAFREGVPMRRLIGTADVAAAAALLASADAAMITGVMLPVDGGITAR
jgi:NAD(P)-dependent dehydrogenase (short-subunit alcohol dehydrogenase family)